jgi:PPP family 3-phenylpropionic acid transporter
MLGRVVTGPLLAVWADGFRHPPRAHRPAGRGHDRSATAGPGWSTAIAPQALGWFVGRDGRGGADAPERRADPASGGALGFTFALPRACGSAAFVAVNVIMGALLLNAPVDAIVVWLVTAMGLGVAVVAALVLPAEPVGRRARRCGGVSGSGAWGGCWATRPS